MASWHISAYKNISIKSADRDSMDDSHLKKKKKPQSIKAL